MLKANKSAWFEKIFAIYNRHLFKRRFSAIRVEGIENLRSFPLVVYCNHSSWWDGLVAFQISRKAKLDSFMMMEEKQLRNLSLFRRLGVFSVVREKPREAIESINYAVKLIKDAEKRVVWIFPQGEILPNDIRPLRFYNGVSKIIANADRCFAVPVAIRYEFFGEWKPEVLVKIGKAEQIGKADWRKSTDLSLHLANTLTKTLDELNSDIIQKRTENYLKL